MTSDAFLMAEARIAARAVAICLTASLVAALSFAGMAGASSPPPGRPLARPIASTVSPEAKAKAPCQRHGKHGTAVTGACPTPEVSTNSSWSGYTITGSQVGEPITSITGSWTVPHSDSNSISTWIGVDGMGAPGTPLLQTGVGEGSPWWQELPQQSTQQNISEFQQNADEMYASITRQCNTSSTWTITLIDETQGWTWTKTVTYTGPAQRADWIVESPVHNGGHQTLPQYTTIYFTHLTVNGSSPHLNSNDELVMNQGSGQVSTPSLPDTAGDAFGMGYGSTSPAAPPNQLGYNGWGETFQPLGGDGDLFDSASPTGAYVIGKNRQLWLDVPPWNSYPPHRSYIDSCARAVQALSATSALVLGLDNNLWLETAPWDSTPPHRTRVDGNVEAFQMVDGNTIFVLGTDGHLWEETTPFGPSHRKLVAGGATGASGEYGAWDVSSFQAISTTQVLVLYNGVANAGWLARLVYPYAVPANYTLVDGNVDSFQAVNIQSPTSPPPNIYVLGTNGNLWNEYGAYGPNNRNQVDGSVRRFQVMGTQLATGGYDDQVWVMHLDGDLDAEADGNYYNSGPVEIDANVATMVPVNMYFLVTLGTDGFLWLEQTPFNGTVPPQRARVDASVAF